MRKEYAQGSVIARQVRERMEQLDARIQSLLQSQQDAAQNAQKQFQEQSGVLAQLLDTRRKELLALLDENHKLLRSLREDSRLEVESLSSIERKMDYVDKALELRLKGFEDILRAQGDLMNKEIRVLQDSHQSQRESLEIMQESLAGLRYWVVAGFAITFGIILGFSILYYYINKGQGLEASRTNNLYLEKIQAGNLRLLDAVQLTLQQNNERLLDRLSAIYRENKVALQGENKKLINGIQTQNKQMFNGIERSREDLSTLIDILQTPPPAPSKESAPYEEQAPTTEGETGEITSEVSPSEAPPAEENP